MARHIHIHFAPRRTRDQALGSVPGQQRHPPAEVSKLVQVLMQAIADRQAGRTMDTKFRDAGEWDESKHPRAEGGQFTSAQHAAAAKNHEDAASAHEASAQASMGPVQAAHAQAAAMHKEAADLHAKAHSHMAANTGLGQEFAKSAHAKTRQAAAASNSPAVQQAQNSMGEAYSKLKAVAGDPKQPVARRAEAVKHLEAMEKQAETLAKSPHAQANPKAVPIAGSSMEQNAMAENEMAKQKAAAGAGGPAGDKPTMATAAGSAKAKTHQLLSSGHPFHVEELMKATGVTNKATIMTALSDLKNPKYAGALGALTIEKRPDGMYHVTKAPAGGFKAVGGAAAPNATPGAAPTPGTPAAPDAGAADDPTRVANATHPMSDYLPGQHLQGNGVNGKLWKVLGHNAEGHVVIQSKETGAKHHMDPVALKKAAKGVADPDSMKDMTAANPTAKVQARMDAKQDAATPSHEGVANALRERLGPDTSAAMPNTFAEYKAAKSAAKQDITFPAGRKSAAEVTRESQARIDRAQKGSKIPSVREAVAKRQAALPTHPELQAAARRMGENPSTAPKHTPGSMVPAPESALKAGMAAGLKKNLKSQATEGKNRVERALGNHSSTFVKRAIAAQGKPKMNVDPISHRTSMEGGVPHRSPEPGEPGYEQWKANRAAALARQKNTATGGLGQPKSRPGAGLFAGTDRGAEPSRAAQLKAIAPKHTPGSMVPKPGTPGYAAYKAASTKPQYTYTGEDPKALPSQNKVGPGLITPENSKAVTEPTRPMVGGANTRAMMDLVAKYGRAGNLSALDDMALDHPAAAQYREAWIKHVNATKGKNHVGSYIKPGSHSINKLADLSATELANRLADNYARRPSSLARAFGKNGPTPEQLADYNAKARAHANERSRLQAAHKIALERDNKKFRESNK